MPSLAFLDTETTGLDPDRHEIWEVGLILREGDVLGDGGPVNETEHHWFLPVDLGRADPMALAIGRFHERWEDPTIRIEQRGDTTTIRRTYDARTILASFATEFVELTRGAMIVGAVSSFDADRLWRLLRRAHECPMWHYHLIDVENLAAGYAIGRLRGAAIAGDVTKFPGMHTAAVAGRALPWDSTDLSRSVGVDPERFDRHTALGDVRWAMAIFDAVLGQNERYNRRDDLSVPPEEPGSSWGVTDLSLLDEVEEREVEEGHLPPEPTGSGARPLHVAEEPF